MPRYCSQDSVLVVSNFAPSVTPWLRISGTFADTSSLSIAFSVSWSTEGFLNRRLFSKCCNYGLTHFKLIVPAAVIENGETSSSQSTFTYSTRP